MAASELMVQPQVAQAQVDAGAIARHRPATLRRLIEEIIGELPRPLRRSPHATIERTESRGRRTTADDQPLNFNLSERRRTAGLMSPSESYAVVQRFEGDDGLRNDGRRRC